MASADDDRDNVELCMLFSEFASFFAPPTASDGEGTLGLGLKLSAVESAFKRQKAFSLPSEVL